MTVEAREFYQNLIADLSHQAESCVDPQEFCEDIVEAFRPILAIDAMVMAVPFDDSTFDVVSRYNRSYARLDQGRFLKINRKTPLADAIRFQTIQAWGTNQKLLLEYPEALTWQVVPHAVIAIPLVENGATIAGCVYAMRDEFTNDQEPLYCEILEVASRLLYQVYLKQLRT